MRVHTYIEVQMYVQLQMYVLLLIGVYELICMAAIHLAILLCHTQPLDKHNTCVWRIL